MNTNLNQYVDKEHQNFIEFRERMLEVELELFRLANDDCTNEELDALATNIQLALKESFRGLIG